jgi:hypothetical protein
MLQLDSDAQATVLCADLTAWPVPAGAPSGALGGCKPPSKPPLIRVGWKVGATKAQVDPLIPYVVSPRMTRLLSDQPTLRWNAVTGVITYTVGIRGDDGTDWQTQTTSTQIAYPADAPALRPGVSYLLLVQDDSGRSSREEDLPGLGFRVLAPEEAEPIQSDVERLRALSLPSEAASFALAHLYAGHGLIAEAVDLLEALAESGSQEPAVYRTLGNLYHRIRLERLAEASYLQAVELAEQARDVEGKAAALVSLGEIYIGWGNRDEALLRWKQALAQYQALGDKDQIEHVQKRIDESK